LHLKQFSTLSKERKMSTRYLIAAALMASACVAHADVLPGTTSTVSSDAVVKALYDKVSASVGSDSKVSLMQGPDGLYVKGLTSAKALALAGDGMAVINTANGFKIVQGLSANGNFTSGGGAAVTGSSGGNSVPAANTGAGNSNGAGNAGTGTNASANAGTGLGNGNGNGVGTDASVGIGNGNANGNGNLGNQAADAASVPEPSSIALMLAGMLGVAGLGRRRSR
jgi:hypothetical protein